MKSPKKAARSSPRKQLETIRVSSISSLENLTKIARHAEITEASVSGFKLLVRREDLVPLALRRNLNIDAILGTKVLLHLPQMNIEIAGKVARTQLLGKRGYEVGIDYSEDAPEYWRECLLDLLPGPGEID